MKNLDLMGIGCENKHRKMKLLIYPPTIVRETVSKLILVFVRSFQANQNPTSYFFQTERNLKTEWLIQVLPVKWLIVLNSRHPDPWPMWKEGSEGR